MKKMSKREQNWEEVVYFYGPYPKHMERIKALPPRMREVLDSLNGREMSIKSAVEKTKGAIEGIPKSCVAIGTMSRKCEKKSFIWMHIKDDAGKIHSWRLIKFKPIGRNK